MIRICAGQANRFRHLWVEVYVRLPAGRTLCLMWTRGIWHSASVADLPYRTITGSL